jgi:hypothetical protein
VTLRTLATAFVGVLLLTAAAQGAPDFDREVAPLLARRCLECHSGAQPEGGFTLSERATAMAGGDSGVAIRAGNSGQSLLWQRVSAGEMPPSKPLPDDEQRLLKEWIDTGAEWGTDPIDPFRYSTDKRAGLDWWSLQPIVRPHLPAAASVNELRAPIDAFVAARLDATGLTESPTADRTTLIRRLYLDVLGLPPSLEEIDTFTADDAPDAWERLVERVLASPRYGERWARHWLDVVRFAESHGFETNVERPYAYHYRDYVIRALNSDKPYDEFVFEQLAGDTVGQDAATGFIVGGAYDRVKGLDPLLGLMQRQDELTDMVNTTGTAFLGLTLGCARCHNHKFDPVTQGDFYGLQAVFAGVQHDDRRVARELHANEQSRVAQLTLEQTELSAELQRLVPPPVSRNTLIIDDEDAARVKLLADIAGHGVNPTGNGRGEVQDAGGPGRVPNVSGGRYTWWRPTPGADVCAYRPGRAGEFRVWLSWGCGWTTHTTDAQYVLDYDGRVETRDDQRVIAVVDQQRFADGSRDVPGRPLWSGFKDAGIHTFGVDSRLILRCGESGTAITADVIVLEESPAALAQPALRAPVTPTGNEERFAPVRARAVRFTIRATNSGMEPCLDELEIWTQPTADCPAENVALAARGARASSSSDYVGNPKHKLEHIHDAQYGNDRSWISGEAGRGWVQLDLAEPAVIERIVWQRDRQGQFPDRTPADYEIAVADEVFGSDRQWQVVAGSRDRAPIGSPGGVETYVLAALPADAGDRAREQFTRLKGIESELAALREPVTMYAGRFEQPGPTQRLYRGDPLSPREQVVPAVLSALRERVAAPQLASDAPEQARRVALAQWLTDPAHPLPARVIVNRLWQQHFGRGIVGTPSDFGAMGARPTHPELLDWLAAELIESGWSLKHIHRLILNSATYRQSSAPRAECLEADAGTELLWRFPPRRVEAEVIRDSILAVSGNLEPDMYGQGYMLFHPNDNYSRNWIAKDEFGPGEFRRMIYALKLRMKDDAVFSAFDCPDAGQIMPARPRSTTPIQALNLLNSPFVAEQAEALAARVQRDAGDDTVQQVAEVFRLAFGREPDAEEAQAARELVAAQGLAALARGVFNANEFLFLP